ncbi:T-cell activation Rho GTPase-activating protein [Erinaceus europaeus]|uniref:T-cell activation Rho GTPase-activating protein n=1 Tax=Erinaceus europaeus TaxID=9365 RepID=A0A1S2ZAC0_ERIEU|nr:T-cell activation Rho GTPase-activating protein [Erinaceus europaeus]
MKLLSSRNASKTLNASDMETFIQCQSEGDIKKHPLLVPSESEDSLCQLIEIKKRKKVLSWPFLMKKLSSSSDFPGASESNLKASLFDQPLSAICRGENTLPKSIQDILTVLCLKGPSTEGIFRKAASEKARKELKEELNSGAAVDLKSLPVHLLAAVFKDFLRSIPQKLLSCDLFEEWMEALEKQNEEDRIEALKLVAEKLPALNLLLLKHLVSVLYLISKNSDTSKMDASNLAICIGPSVLARVQDRGLSLQAQKDLNSKVKTLVEFLIENCLEIFGENIPTHPSTASDDSLEHTDSSDLSTLQNDSAYDSNDPDAEPSSAVSSLNRPLETPSLEPRGPQQAWESSREPLLNTVAKLRGTLGKPDRSYSEPSMFLSQDRPDSPPLMGRQGHFSVALETSSTSENKDSEDPFPEEEFPTTEGKSSRPRDLRLKSLTGGSALKAMSSGSLDASSDGSPGPSPSSPQGSFFSRHQSFTKTEKTKPSREIRKHSLSFSFTSHQRVLAKTSSVGSVGVQGLPRDQGKKGLERGSQLSGRIVRENQCDVPSPVERSFACRPQALSVEDVFRFVDQRSPGSPPSYQEAILCPTAYGSQTVDSMRARVLSLGTLAAHHGGSDSRHLCRQDSPNGRSLGHRTEGWHLSRTVCASGKAKGHMAVVLRPELQQLPTGSESKQKTKRGYLVSRCSHPVFEAEQLQYAKESYI